MNEPFLYHGKPLDPNPIERPLAKVAHDLVCGRTVSVTLEPGDATRYQFLLAPMVDRLIQVGNYSDEDEAMGLICVRFVSGHVEGAGVILLNRSFHDDMYKLMGSNGWSHDVMEWWFGQLREAMEAEQAYLAAVPSSFEGIHP